jgi:DNA-binding NtrC family response regulator
LELCPHTPVIIISGITDQDHAQALIRLGAFDYLLKPFRLEVVEKSVKRALEYGRKAAKQKESSDSSDSQKNDWNLTNP